MTAEITVMNRLGMAMAADSAVVVGSTKIYSSAEKLFQLSNHAPVGVMIYNAATFLNLPWETIIKLFRKDLDQTTFDTTADYASSFLAYLKNNKDFYPEHAQANLVYNLSATIFEQIRGAVNNRLQTLTAFTPTATKDLVHRVTEEALEHTATECDYLHEVDDSFVSMVKRRHKDLILQALPASLQPFPYYKKTEKAFLGLAAEWIARQPFGPLDAGIVIGGYGEGEYYPSVVELKIRGVVKDKLLFTITPPRGIDDHTRSEVLPFAQRDMVTTFMEGIGDDLRLIITQSTQEVITGIFNEILTAVRSQNDILANALDQVLRPSLQNRMNGLFRLWEIYLEANNRSPIMDMVAALPKDELAAMAESLVNLTKFKRRVSRDQESVGGPIDVAVITKGDGFVWVKRKHYFPADLNLRYLAKHNNAGGGQ